jgi:hypothetical protein
LRVSKQRIDVDLADLGALPHQRAYRDGSSRDRVDVDRR